MGLVVIVLTPKAQIQDGGNNNTLDCNIFHVDTRSSQDILILIFCTSLQQCSVNEIEEIANYFATSTRNWSEASVFKDIIDHL